METYTIKYHIESKKISRTIDKKQQPKYSSLKYTSEVFGVLLNIFTIAVVLMSYFLVRLSHEIAKKVNDVIWYYPNKICRSLIFTKYYNRVMVFLDELKSKATDSVLYDRVTSNDVEYNVRNVVEEEVAEDILHEQDVDDHDTATPPPAPETPTVVIAEIHTQDTPESIDDDSPHSIRFRTPGIGNEPGPNYKKNLTEELEEDKVKNESTTSEQESDES